MIKKKDLADVLRIIDETQNKIIERLTKLEKNLKDHEIFGSHIKD